MLLVSLSQWERQKCEWKKMYSNKKDIFPRFLQICRISYRMSSCFHTSFSVFTKDVFMLRFSKPYERFTGTVFVSTDFASLFALNEYLPLITSMSIILTNIGLSYNYSVTLLFDLPSNALFSCFLYVKHGTA